MAQHWLGKHAPTEDTDARELRRDLDLRGAWQPLRLDHAAAVDRAALMADRFVRQFLRQFLRLMKCFRDGHKLHGR